MDFSLFSTDGGLGDVGYHTVLVKIGGTGVSWANLSRAAIVQSIRQALTDNGIGVLSLTDVTGFSANPFHVYVQAVINASNDDNADSLRGKLLASISGTVSDPTIEMVSGRPSGGGGGGGGNDFFDQFGLGLGISTPVVIGAAALLVLILVTRK